MDNVIRRLSDIEDAAGAIMDQAAARKREMALEMEKKKADFDRKLEKETADRIAELHSKMEEETQALLDKQSQEAKEQIRLLEQRYEAGHREYAECLFQKMIKE